jgi:hypothetical protein
VNNLVLTIGREKKRSARLAIDPADEFLARFTASGEGPQAVHVNAVKTNLIKDPAGPWVDRLVMALSSARFKLRSHSSSCPNTLRAFCAAI